MTGKLVLDLNTEWAHLVSTEGQQVAEWSRRVPVFRGCGDLDEVLRAIACEPDKALVALITEAQAGHYLAGRAVLQTMLDKLVCMSGEFSAVPRNEILDDLVAQLWVQIAQYPLTRRPTKVAANLALDARKSVVQVRRRHNPELATDSESRLGQMATSIEEDTLTAVGVLQAATDMGLLTRATRDVLVSIYGPEELSGASAALRWGCTPSAIRTRCKEARRRLADHAADLAAAA